MSPTRESSGGKVVVVVVTVLALLVGGGYAAAGALAGDRVPRGTTVAGVEIGGQTPAQARETLVAGLAEREQTPLTVRVDGTPDGTVTLQVDPADAGLAVDHAATVAEAGGGASWAPDRLWSYWTGSLSGGTEVDPVVTVDDTALDAAVQRLIDQVGTDPVDAAVDFVGTRVRTPDAVAGETLDPQTTRDALVAAYLSDDASLTLETTPVAPAISDEDAEAAVEDFANPALAAPVTLLFGDSPVKLQPHQYAKALSLVPQDGALVPDVDTDTVLRLVGDATASGDPVDATVALKDGKPHVVPAKPGVDYEPEAVTSAFLDLLTQPDGQRTGEVEASVVEPDLTTKDARRLKVRQKVSSFTTYYPDADYRNTNIGRAAELVDGTLLQPGETFSLNDTVGERTIDNGFTDGFIISGGILKEDLGGGVSQLATTLFNAMFFAGLEDVEHKPHSFYIDRYPVGREATVAWGSVDLRFRNDTKYGVLISAKVTPSTASSQGVVTVTMYSTKVWDITTKTGERYDFTSPTTRTLRTPDCYAYTGSGGFTIDVWRYFRKHGEKALDHEEKLHTVYTPSDSVVCKPPKKG